jgi:hypothetical protein
MPLIFLVDGELRRQRGEQRVERVVVLPGKRAAVPASAAAAAAADSRGARAAAAAPAPASSTRVVVVLGAVVKGVERQQRALGAGGRVAPGRRRRGRPSVGSGD